EHQQDLTGHRPLRDRRRRRSPVQGLLPRERPGGRPAAALPAHRRRPQPPVARAAGGRGGHRRLPGDRLRPAPPRQVRPPGEHRVVEGGVQALRRPLRELHHRPGRRPGAGGPDLHGLLLRRQRRPAAGAPPPRPLRRGPVGRGRGPLPGLLPGLVAAPARQRRPGVRQRGVGPHGPAVPRQGPLEDVVLLLPGLRGVQGRPALLLRRPRPPRQARGDRRRGLPGGDDDRGVRLPHHPRGQPADRRRDHRWHVHRHARHRALPDEREPRGVPHPPAPGAAGAAGQDHREGPRRRL
ncbi:MAG: Putative hydrolase, partial [uncultured Quadrisphaera sp.]